MPLITFWQSRDVARIWLQGECKTNRKNPGGRVGISIVYSVGVYSISNKPLFNLLSPIAFNVQKGTSVDYTPLLHIPYWGIHIFWVQFSRIQDWSYVLCWIYSITINGGTFIWGYKYIYFSITFLRVHNQKCVSPHLRDQNIHTYLKIQLRLFSFGVLFSFRHLNRLYLLFLGGSNLMIFLMFSGASFQLGYLSEKFDSRVFLLGLCSDGAAWRKNG